GQDARLYDWGQFSIATQGMATGGQNQGELWCTYDIELFKPKLTQGQYGYEINTFHTALATTASATNYFPPSFTYFNNMAMVVGASTLTFPQAIVTGVYRITYYISGSSGATSTPSFTATSNCALGPGVFHGTQSSSAATLGPQNTGYFVLIGYVTINGPAAVVTISGGTFPAGISGGDLIIEQVNGLFA
ncbi:unnamed protein product, partial [Didymodactylos carnosus]